jgi:hypothetical protein
MIKPGTNAIVVTVDAEYSPCTVVNLNAKNLTVRYVKKVTFEDGQIVRDIKTDIIPKSDIISITEMV